LSIPLPKLHIYFVINFIPVVPAGKCDAKSHESEKNFDIYIIYLPRGKKIPGQIYNFVK
jgi:hypothetical protein